MQMVVVDVLEIRGGGGDSLLKFHGYQDVY